MITAIYVQANDYRGYDIFGNAPRDEGGVMLGIASNHNLLEAIEEARRFARQHVTIEFIHVPV
jgi:hypothetical protein